jgi:hypothetical protein
LSGIIVVISFNHAAEQNAMALNQVQEVPLQEHNQLLALRELIRVRQLEQLNQDEFILHHHVRIMVQVQEVHNHPIITEAAAAVGHVLQEEIKKVLYEI